MQNLVIFRMFLYFPLIGFMLPDIGSLLSGAHEAIPMGHIMTEAVLIIFIAAFTARIAVVKRRQNNAGL